MASFKHVKRLSRGPVVLAIWDGFGFSTRDLGNAPLHAKMPTWQSLLKHYPNTLLATNGRAVGLPPAQPGNSEAGHTVMGAGRIVESDVLRISRAIDDKSFFDNPALLKAAAHVLRENSTLHLAGLLTAERSGHASYKHIIALIDFAKKMKLPRVALHFFTDGRDARLYQALPLLQEIQKHLPPNFMVASLIGRFYAMDRNRFWERTELAYNLMVSGEGIVAPDPVTGLMEGYARGETDEFLMPTVIRNAKGRVTTIQDHDAVIFWNLRSDRARQMIKPFIIHNFEAREPGAFVRHDIRKDIFFVTLTEFGAELDHTIPAFPHRPIANTLVEELRYHKQLYVAESEKFSQVTYFFNGGNDRARFGEERIRIPSLRIARYSDRPEMRAPEITRRVVKALDDGYDFICVNYANADMVGHNGDYQAGIKACEALDQSLAVLWKKIKQKRATLLVVGDHGNIEQMLLAKGGVDTEHNPNPVPFLAAGEAASKMHLRRGDLSDVAPTVLKLLGLPKAPEMTGHSLLVSAWLKHLTR